MDEIRKDGPYKRSSKELNEEHNAPHTSQRMFLDTNTSATPLTSLKRKALQNLPLHRKDREEEFVYKHRSPTNSWQFDNPTVNKLYRPEYWDLHEWTDDFEIDVVLVYRKKATKSMLARQYLNNFLNNMEKAGLHLRIVPHTVSTLRQSYYQKGHPL